MEYRLRPYQEEAAERFRQAVYELGFKAPLIHQATGTGKTALAATIARRHFGDQQQRILFVVSYRDLVYQSQEAFLKWWPELSGQWGVFSVPGTGIVMADDNQVRAKVIFATPQTLVGKDNVDFSRLDPILSHGKIDLVIYDEAHRSVSDSYLALHQRLKEENPDLIALGLTATPQRRDERALGMIFDTIAYSYPLWRGVAEGYLAPPEDPIQVQTKGVSDGKLTRLGEVQNWGEILWEAIKEYAPEKSGIMFMPSVEASEHFAEYMRGQGVSIAHIADNKTIGPDGEKWDRQGVLRLYKAGEIKYLTNYNVLTTGIDAPITKLVVWGRMTDDPVALTQAIGRGTRLYNGMSLTIIDFALKGMEILLSGTLLGLDAELYKQEAPEDEVELQTLGEAPPIIDIRDTAPDVWEIGEGVYAQTKALLASRGEAWQTDMRGNASAIANPTLAYVIINPYHTLARHIAMGIERGESATATPKNQDLLSRLREAYRVFANYSLWEIKGSRKTSKKGKTYTKWTEDPTLLRVDSAAASCVNEATFHIANNGDEKYASKKRAWRRQKARNNAGMKFLLENRKETLSEYGLAFNIEALNMSTASKLVTHADCMRSVQPVLDRLQAQCGKYGVITHVMHSD